MQFDPTGRTSSLTVKIGGFVTDLKVFNFVTNSRNRRVLSEFESFQFPIKRRVCKLFETFQFAYKRPEIGGFVNYLKLFNFFTNSQNRRFLELFETFQFVLKRRVLCRFETFQFRTKLAKPPPVPWWLARLHRLALDGTLPTKARSQMRPGRKRTIVRILTLQSFPTSSYAIHGKRLPRHAASASFQKWVAPCKNRHLLVFCMEK